MEQAVYKAINAVQIELSREGITKDRKNTQQGYSFRGIDDVYNALSPLLGKHGLCILPRTLSRTMTERESKQGGALFNVVVEIEFDFISADDGSKHTVGPIFGEAMDSADKATNKAMSASFKNMVFLAFAVPTEGDNDADAQTHEAKVVATKGAGFEIPKQRPLSIKQTLWDNLKVHCNGKNGEAGKILKHLTGKQFISDVTEDEAAVAQVKFEADFLGEVRE